MKMKIISKKTCKLIIAGVITIILAAGSLTFYINAKGYETTDDAQIDANLITVKSSVTAYVNQILFTDNEPVHKGQLLVIFDTTELKAKVSEALSDYENARVNMLLAENEVYSGNSDLNANEENTNSVHQNFLSAKATLVKSNKNYERTFNLYRMKAATQEQLDDAKATSDIAQADYKRILSLFKSSISTTNSYRQKQKGNYHKIEQARINIKQKKAALELAKINLSHAYVYAPCNGYITKKSIHEGQYVASDQSLCCLIDNSEFWITANFKETQIYQLKKGQFVDIKVDAYPEMKIKGEIASFSEATDAKFSLIPPDNASSNFTKVVQRISVKIRISNISPSLKGKLFPGMSSYVSVDINHK